MGEACGDMGAEVPAASPGGGRSTSSSKACADAAKGRPPTDGQERGNAHFKNKQWEEALAAYAEALTLEPKDAGLWLNRSITNRQLKNWQDAELDAHCAVEIQPANVKAHYSRA